MVLEPSLSRPERGRKSHKQISRLPGKTISNTVICVIFVALPARQDRLCNTQHARAIDFKITLKRLQKEFRFLSGFQMRMLMPKNELAMNVSLLVFVGITEGLIGEMLGIKRSARNRRVTITIMSPNVERGVGIEE